MFKDISFGQYYPVNSVVHRLDARIKFLMTVVFVVSIFFIKSYFGFMLTAVFLLSVILLSRLPIMSVLKSVRGILFIVIFTSIINLFFVKEGTVLAHWEFITITEKGLHTTVKIILRLVLLISGASVLSLTTTPVALADGLESLMRPLKTIKVPVHEIALIMSIALRFIPTLFEETNKIIAAQKARGASFDTGSLLSRAKALLPVLIPLFINSFRRAEELAFAMDARCYNATDKRTKLKIAKLHIRDLLAVLFVLGFFTVILLDNYMLNVDLLMFGRNFF